MKKFTILATVVALAATTSAFASEITPITKSTQAPPTSLTALGGGLTPAGAAGFIAAGVVGVIILTQNSTTTTTTTTN